MIYKRTNLQGPKEIGVPKSQIIPIKFKPMKKTFVVLLGQWMLTTDDKSIFLDLQPKKGGKVILGGDQHGIIIGIDQVSLKPSFYVSNVLFVDRLNHNRLNLRKLCDNDCDVVFNKDKCIINKHNGTHLFTAKVQGNLHNISMDELTAKKFIRSLTIWHMKYGHVSLKLLSNLNK